VSYQGDKLSKLMTLYDMGMIPQKAVLEALGVKDEDAKPFMSQGHCSNPTVLKSCPFCQSNDLSISSEGTGTRGVRCLGCGCEYMHVADGVELPDYILENSQTCDSCYHLFPNSALWDMPDKDGCNLRYCQGCIEEVRCISMANLIEEALDGEDST